MSAAVVVRVTVNAAGIVLRVVQHFKLKLFDGSKIHADSFAMTMSSILGSQYVLAADAPARLSLSQCRCPQAWLGTARTTKNSRHAEGPMQGPPPSKPAHFRRPEPASAATPHPEQKNPEVPVARLPHAGRVGEHLPPTTMTGQEWQDRALRALARTRPIRRCPAPCYPICCCGMLRACFMQIQAHAAPGSMCPVRTRLEPAAFVVELCQRLGVPDANRDAWWPPVSKRA